MTGCRSESLPPNQIADRLSCLCADMHLCMCETLSQRNETYLHMCCNACIQTIHWHLHQCMYDGLPCGSLNRCKMYRCIAVYVRARMYVSTQRCLLRCLWVGVWLCIDLSRNASMVWLVCCACPVCLVCLVWSGMTGPTLARYVMMVYRFVL